jgi:hypothetical protein
VIEEAALPVNVLSAIAKRSILSNLKAVRSSFIVIKINKNG